MNRSPTDMGLVETTPATAAQETEVCECCGEWVTEYRIGWDGAVCHRCEPPETHQAPETTQ